MAAARARVAEEWELAVGATAAVAVAVGAATVAVEDRLGGPQGQVAAPRAEAGWEGAAAPVGVEVAVTAAVDAATTAAAAMVTSEAVEARDPERLRQWRGQ